MKIAVIGHASIDSVKTNEEEWETIGGSLVYSGITLNKFGIRIKPITKIGKDFSQRWISELSKSGIKLNNNDISRKQKTTRFRITINENQEREIKLIEKCEDISEEMIKRIKADGIIINPIANEISLDSLKKILRNDSVTYVDPQGFLRRFDKEGKCKLTEVNQENFSQANILKINMEEAKMITGHTSPENIINTLNKNEIKVIILTQGSKGTYIINNKRINYLPFKKKINIKDTTGAGDILAGAFMAKYLETKDEIESLCTATAIVRIALSKKTVNKIPELNEIENEKEELSRNIIRKENY